MTGCGLGTEQSLGPRPAQDRATPIRVTLVSHYYPAHRGGVERVAGQLAERLARASIAQIAWHASDCDPPPPPLRGMHCIPAASWNAFERGLGFPYPLWTPSALARLVRAARAADVVHLHDCLYLPNLVAFAAARLAGRPVLVTQHIGFVPYRNPVLRILLAAANRLVGRLVLGGATQAVFESESVRRYFTRFVRFRSAPLLVPNGVDTQVFVPADPDRREALRARHGALPGTPLFLFVGRFVEKKGVHVLRALTERIPQARWVLAGWGPLDPASWGRPNVTVVRSPSIDDLAPLYQAADLFVLPSAGEGFPLAVQEAMACGTPALVGTETAEGCPIADAPILSEATAVQDEESRWSARLEALARAPETLRALRPRVAAFAREHWSWERCVERYAALLRACLEPA
jgi:glycosyltransferase involved in cell wall biosynthesis